MTSNLFHPRALATIVALLSVVSGTACEKKKDLTFAQGYGENLFAISDFTGKTFTVKTGQRRFKGQTSRADRLFVLDNFDGINSLDAVEFEVKEGLFAGVDLSDYNFYGRENHEYTLKYSFTDNNVILSKVASKKDIPSEELTFAKAIDGDLFEVPMMGLPIGLLTVEQVRDDRGKETRKLATYTKDYLSESTHFKINANQVRYFEAPVKQDLLRADYFNTNDEWLYTKTIIGRAINSEAILGDTQAALKIKFARTNNSILGVDLNIAQEQEVLDPTKINKVLEIPAEWVDFKLVTAGGNAQLKEDKLGDKETGSRSWQERSYALVDFNNVDRLSRSYTADNKLEKLEISQDYISFTIYESSSGNTYKYSLAKNNTRVPGQNLYADDTKLFHIFAAKRKVIDGALYRQEPDVNKLVYANRFYPENKEIVYHISENTPDHPEYIAAIQKAVTSWDEAFVKAGTGIRVRLDDRRVQMGDVRFNQIGFYGYEIDSSFPSGGMLLGFGPSVQDTRTGQTFVAATHIYLRAYREGVIGNIRGFIRNELGLYDDKKVTDISQFKKSDELIAGGTLLQGSTSGLSNVASLYHSFKEGGDRGFEKLALIEADFAQQLEETYGSNQLKAAMRKQSSAKAQKATQICTHGNVAASANNWQKIRSSCLGGQTKLSAYLDQLKAAHAADPRVLNLDGEEEAILECAQPLMPDLLVSTLIHEIGHNLGLGHNFAGSSDGPNFAKNSDGSIAYPSSSVMDYPARDFDLFDRAGPYDVAAIRYLYGRTFESEDGRVISIGPKQSIFDAARSANAKPKNYEVCNDYLNGDNLPLYNPLCLKWDVGATPSEFVDWAIAQIHADMIQNGYVYNDIRLKAGGTSASYFINFRQIHDYWRFLMYNETGKYLEKKNAKDLQAYILERSSRDPVFRQYTEATQKIFDFAIEVIKLPSRICVVRDTLQNASVGLEEFRRLRSNIFQTTGTTVQSCKEATSFLASVRPQYADRTVALEDKGLDIKNLELDLNPAATADRLKRGLDFTQNVELNPSYSTGSLVFKVAALNMLGHRKPIAFQTEDGTRIEKASLQLLTNTGMFVNFLDVPWFYKALTQTTIDQLLYGADLQQLGLGEEGSFMPFFEDNADFTMLMTAKLIADAGSVPQSPARVVSEAFQMTPLTNSQTLASFVPAATRQFDPSLIYTKNSQTIFGAEESSQPYARALVRQLELMKQVAAFAELSAVLPLEMQRIASGGSDPSTFVISSFEAFGGLYLQTFQYQNLAASLARVATRQADGTLTFDEALLPAAIESFFKSETEIMGWPRAEFEAALQFKASLPDNFSAQLQMLNSLVQSGIIL